MNHPRFTTYGPAKLALALLAFQPLAGIAQVPVDDNGKVIGAYEPALAAENQGANPGDVPLMSAVDLEELVGPVALYPDDLLAIILPAAAYPQQVREAAEFLKRLEDDSSLKPDSDWDDSVVALLNYPEVIELMSDDIDWTWRLGEAVIAQQKDVVSAIEAFRDRAYNAGNLKSDKYQTVSRDDGHIEISPVEDDVIYVPYYEPERVVVYQPRPVYYYYPRSYPVYYYPYTSSYHFNRGYFWGVTTAFSIGWFSDSLHVYHHSYHGHPYYGRHYWDRWWYRRPTMHSYHSNYIGNSRVTVNNYYSGDRWRPRPDRRNYVMRDVKVANNRYMESRASNRRASEQRRIAERTTRTQTVRQQEPIAFRERQSNGHSQTLRQRPATSTNRGNTREQGSNRVIRQDGNYVAQQRERQQDTSRQSTTTRQQPTTSLREERRQQPDSQSREQRRESPPRVQQQRRQYTTPPQQDRTQRTTPPQQRSAPRTQQRSAPQPQHRSAPQPQRSAPPPQQQRSAPQRQERSESRSSQSSRSESRNSGRRERR